MNTARPVTVALVGYGPVGTRYAQILHERRREFAERYGIDLQLVAVRGSASETTVRDRCPPAERRGWAKRTSFDQFLLTHAPHVVAQAVPSTEGVASEALSDALTALKAGAHVVTATKTPLLSGWSHLDAAARAASRSVRISGATGAALPAGDTARLALRGFPVESIRGCLGGTASFVLDRLAEGTDLADAVSIAQARGIAEADPAADLTGADASIKIRLLAGLHWGWDVSSCAVVTEPIDESTAARAADAAARGAVLRHVAAATARRPDHVQVTLEEFDRSQSPFGTLTGPEKTVTFECGDAGDITISGGRSSPYGAAMSMVKDTLSLAIEPSFGLG